MFMEKVGFISGKQTYKLPFKVRCLKINQNLENFVNFLSHVVLLCDKHTVTKSR